MLTNPHHQRSPTKTVLQWLVRWMFRIQLTLLYRIRVHGLENFPEPGSTLICSNHQSFLDPVVLGVVSPRPLNYLARKTLFKITPVRLFLELNDATPIDLDSMGMAGIKESLKRLKRGEMLVVFPEGTRSDDGELLPLKPGFDLLARRSKARMLPIALDGCFQAFPRDAKLPRPGKIQVVIGEPIEFDEYKNWTADETALFLQARIAECLAEARRRIANGSSAYRERRTGDHKLE